MNAETAMPMGGAKEKERSTALHKILTVVGAILCALLLPILILNCALIWRTYTNPDSVPKFGGILPLVVQTDVMYPDIQSGDLIVCRSVEPGTLREGDIITFVSASTAEGISVGLNRITEVTSRDGAPMITVNEQRDGESAVRELSAKDVIGVYRRRFRGLGNLILFMRTTQGLVLCVLLPILLLVGYDVLRTRLEEKESRKETEKLAAELEALRASRFGQTPKN